MSKMKLEITRTTSADEPTEETINTADLAKRLFEISQLNDSGCDDKELVISFVEIYDGFRE